MKTLKLISSALLLFVFLVSFQTEAQARKVDKMLQNPTERAYAMLKISNDAKLTTEMIDYLSKNVAAVAQLKEKFGEEDKMKKMMEKMQAKKEKDSTKMKMCPMCKKKMEEKKKAKQEDN